MISSTAFIALLDFSNVRMSPEHLPRSPAFLLLLLLVAALPALVARGLWGEVWRGALPQAWDGSGHYALAHIYCETVFPDTFGWTGAYFAGTALPNYYPPLFYWFIALLQHSGLFTFEAAFKVVLAAPVLLLPASLWLLAWRLSGRNLVAATCAALAAVPLLADVRLTNSAGLMGLSYTSTFLLGLYTQPLGFVLLACWYALYTSEGFAGRVWRAALAAVLLALALLANFFGSNVALPRSLPQRPLPQPARRRLLHADRLLRHQLYARRRRRLRAPHHRQPDRARTPPRPTTPTGCVGTGKGFNGCWSVWRLTPT